MAAPPIRLEPDGGAEGTRLKLSYRFQKLTTIYGTTPPTLRRQPGEALSYQQLYDLFIQRRLGWSDYFTKNLQALGHEASEVFANFEQLQKLWAREHNVPTTKRGWLREIVVAQVREFQPDVLFLEDLYRFDYDLRQQLRAGCARPVTIIGWRGGPTEDFGAFKDIDVLLTPSPGFVDLMRRQGLREVHLFYPGFEPALIDEAEAGAGKDLPFTFVGSLTIGGGFHNQRYVIIERLMDSTPLEVWGEVTDSSGENGSGPARLTNKAIRILEYAGATNWPRTLFSRSAHPQPSIVQRYPERVHKPVFGLDNFKILGRSGITFNRHIDCAGDYAGNVRLFEATGMGACLLTDWKMNLAELFEPDAEVVTYKSDDECLEKAKYLLDHESERLAISAAGQRRALRDHSFKQRTGQLDSIIQDVLSRKTATVKRF